MYAVSPSYRAEPGVQAACDIFKARRGRLSERIISHKIILGVMLVVSGVSGRRNILSAGATKQGF